MNNILDANALRSSEGSPLLEIRNLTIGIDGAVSPIVDDLSFTLKQGSVTAIVGESGSGKTMAARAVLGLLPPPLQISSGSIRFEGTDLASLSVPQLRGIRGNRIGMVFQEPMVSLNPAMRIGTQLIEALLLHRRLGRKEALTRAATMLRRIDIDDVDRCLNAYPHEFSGGMRQRIMLASVMLSEPSLLIADEPTTALDALTQGEVLDLMMRLTRDAGTAILLISHDLALVARYATDVVVMRRGVSVDQGATREILLSPRAEYTRALVDAMPSRWPSRPHDCEGDPKPLVKVESASVVYPGRRSLFRRSPGKAAVSNVAFDLYQGETLALVGGSGSGKTTLGRAMLGLVPLAGGRILFDGRDVARLDRSAKARFRKDCQLIYQDPFSSLDPRMRVGALVGEPLRLERDVSSGERDRRVEKLLDEVGLSGFAGRFPHQLSGGQRQRVAIARALIRRPRLIIADEPVSALDVTVQKQVLALLRSLKASHGFTALFISHDLGVVDEVADRVAVMEHGKIVEIGRKEDVIDRPQHSYTRRLLGASHRLMKGTATEMVVGETFNRAREPAPMEVEYEKHNNQREGART